MVNKTFQYASAEDNSSSSSVGDDDIPIKLPGFGYSISTMPYNIYNQDAQRRKIRRRMRFPTAVIEGDRSEEEITAITFREIIMLRIMNELTDKPEWNRKIFDENIVKKWRDEALSSRSDDITNQCADFCIKELQEKATLLEEQRLIRIFDAHGCVVKSDVSVDAELVHSLQEAVSKLEDASFNTKDYHPGSDGRVVDLVHPSLYPLVYDVTKILPRGRVKLESCVARIGQGVTVEKESSTRNSRKRKSNMTEVDYEHFSTDFQWLPCDVAFTVDRKSRIDSYINNLHPVRHKEMYEVLEKIVDASIPLWNEVLTFWNVGPRIRIAKMDYSYGFPRGISPPENWSSDPGESDEEYASDDTLRKDRWMKRTREFYYPEPSEYVNCKRNPETKEQVDLMSKFKKQGIQVIVKLANIELTPDKPSYEGGTWHIEGLMNEHICATALYYYDCENITDSHLAFRLRFDETDSTMDQHEQDDYENLEIMYNLKNEESAIQTLGEVHTCQGRLLAFPNVFQHKVSSFKLKDPSKPGHRKIIALFLVDPYIRIISTANVPPQQREWWAEQTYEASEKMRNLPAEVFQGIVDSVGDCPYNLSKAKEYREKLMDERRADVEGMNEEFEETRLSFCEH